MSEIRPRSAVASSHGGGLYRLLPGGLNWAKRGRLAASTGAKQLGEARSPVKDAQPLSERWAASAGRPLLGGLCRAASTLRRHLGFYWVGREISILRNLSLAGTPC